MRALSLIPLLFLIQTAAFAEEIKSEPKDLEQDFTLVCEIAKMTSKLSKTKTFKNSEARIAALKSSLTEAALKTPEAKEARKAIAMAEKDMQKALWKQAAKNSGLKNWNCGAL